MALDTAQQTMAEVPRSHFVARDGFGPQHHGISDSKLICRRATDQHGWGSVADFGLAMSLTPSCAAQVMNIYNTVVYKYNTSKYT